jgi:hypothetical protein
MQLLRVKRDRGLFAGKIDVGSVDTVKLFYTALDVGRAIGTGHAGNRQGYLLFGHALFIPCRRGVVLGSLGLLGLLGVLGSLGLLGSLGSLSLLGLLSLWLQRE